MCGIAIVESDSQAARIKHRGLTYGSVDLGSKTGAHFCLPIQTNESSVRQPVELLNGNYLFYNGELFDYPLDRYESDTEYIVDFFNRKPSLDQIIAEINNWEGFWAIVIIDKDRNEAFCFTDPLGKKQLYINDFGEIASEIRPLIRDDFPETIYWDSVYFSEIKKWGYNINRRTPYTHIHRLQPNCIYWIDLSNPKKHRVYNEYFDFKTNLPDENLEQLIKRAVRQRLISRNYPISCLISGGLDSSIIAKELVDLGADVTFFTVENGETEFVDELASYLDINVKYLDYKMSDDFYEAYWANETPVDLGSVVPQFELFKAVKKEGFRITLSGDGADELFGGYKRINKYDSQASDIFDELTYYHLPRLDRLSMYHTLELRSPFLNLPIVKYALNLESSLRINKFCLKLFYKDKLPESIIDRPKEPLKNPDIRIDKFKYIREVVAQFPEMLHNKLVNKPRFYGE